MPSCETCQYYVAEQGTARDNVNIMDFIDPSQNFYNNGFAEGPGSTSRAREIGDNVDRLMKMGDVRRSLEMKVAMQQDGALPEAPQYFAYCTKYSQPGRYVLCKLRNPTGQCPGWSSGSGPDAWSGDGGGGWGGGAGGGLPSGW